MGLSGACYHELAVFIQRLEEVAHHLESDGLNIEKYVTWISAMSGELGGVVGRVAEQEHLRYMAVLTAAGGMGGPGGQGNQSLTRGVMKHRALTK